MAANTHESLVHFFFKIFRTKRTTKIHPELQRKDKKRVREKRGTNIQVSSLINKTKMRNEDNLGRAGGTLAKTGRTQMIKQD